MAEQTTRVLLEIKWDPEKSDHPAGWDYRQLLEGDPFSLQGTAKARLISFEDLDSEGRPVQV